MQAIEDHVRCLNTLGIQELLRVYREQANRIRPTSEEPGKLELRNSELRWNDVPYQVITGHLH